MFQMLIGSMFSLLAASSILYIAYRAYSVGNDVAEMKDLLRDIKRTAQEHQAPAAAAAAVAATEASSLRALASPEAGNWPSVLDPEYNAVDRDSQARPAESRR